MFKKQRVIFIGFFLLASACGRFSTIDPRQNLQKSSNAEENPKNSNVDFFQIPERDPQDAEVLPLPDIYFDDDFQNYAEATQPKAGDSNQAQFSQQNQSRDGGAKIIDSKDSIKQKNVESNPIDKQQKERQEREQREWSASWNVDEDSHSAYDGFDLDTTPHHTPDKVKPQQVQAQLQPKQVNTESSKKESPQPPKAAQVKPDPSPESQKKNQANNEEKNQTKNSPQDSNNSTSEQKPVGQFGGYTQPTIYTMQTLNEDSNGCEQSEKVDLHGRGGVVMTTVCQKSHDVCSLEGSCSIIQGGVKQSYNILNRINGQDRFFVIDQNTCPYGFGVNGVCLDPFYSLAADLDTGLYRVGDVIYIPQIRGVTLPNGQKHNGFFIIRDKGRGIKGVGRFDFYTGHYSWRDPANPFGRLKLQSQQTRMAFYIVKDGFKDRVQKFRNFPSTR